jgi:hypothetical protein
MCHNLAKICSLWEQAISEFFFIAEFSDLLNMPKIRVRSIFNDFLFLAGPERLGRKNFRKWTQHDIAARNEN